ASELTESVRAQPTPLVPTAAVKERRPAPQQVTDAPTAQPTPKVGKDKKAQPPGRQTKSDTSMRELPGNKSTEALIRDALANIGAKRPAPPEPLIAPADPRSVPVDMQPRQTGAPPRQADEPWRVDDPSRAATTKVAPPATDILVQPSSATRTERQP